MTSAFGSATTVGNLIIVCLNTYTGVPGTTAITDAKGNTYTRDFQYAVGLLTQTYYSAPITTGGTAHTITIGAGFEIANLDAVEVSGAATSSPFDKSASNTATSTAYSTGSTGTLTQADEIVIVSVGVDTGDTATITEDASYTLIGEMESGSFYVSNTAYKIVSATTAINHAWTTTFVSTLWFATAATYKAAGAAPPTLAVDSAAHGHTATGGLVLVLPGVFVVDNGNHGHVADNVPFPPQAIPASATHGHTADNVPIPSPALIADDFNRANGALGGNWLFGTGNFTIVSNHAHCTNADFAVYNADTGTPDMFVEADVLNWDATYTVIHGRTTPGTRGSNCYEAFIVPIANGAVTTRTATIGKTVGGGYSDIPGGSATITRPNTAGCKLRLEMQGTTLRLYVDGVLAVTTTDSALTTGNYAGINAQSNGDFDNWSAGPVVAPAINLTVDPAAHGHTASSPTLTLGFLVDSTTHGHTAENILLPATLAVDSAAHGHIATSINIARFLYPVAVANRKLIDQTGGVYILNDFSSWSMASMLTNAEITQALNGVAARHFNAVNVGPFIDNGGPGNGWRKFTNAAGQPFFATVAGGSTPGTPIRDPLGSAWSSMDWIVTECTRLGLTLIYSYFGGYNTANGLTGEANACTLAEVYTFGQRVWNRYAGNPNIVWHLEWEGGWNSTSSPEGQRADAFFHAIQDGHAASGRGGVPLMFAEQGANGNAAEFIGRGWTYFTVSTLSLYQYFPDSVDKFDEAWNQSGVTTYPVWDCEPSYIGATQYIGGAGSYAPLTDQVCRQNWRERNYAVLIRGGVGINFGDEKWWPFGAGGLFPSAPWTWQDVPTNVTSFEAQYCWDLLINPQIVQDPTWLPDNSFLVAGLGSGDTKAAAGRGTHSAVVYFPNNSRTVTVDTTKVGGVTASYLTPSVSVAQTTDQSAFFPTDFTIVAKVRKPAFGSTMTIASQSALVNLDIGWRFGFNAGGALIYDYSTTGTSLNGTMGTLASSVWAGIPTGTPIYVAFSFDNNTTSYTYGGFWSLDGVTWNGPSGGGTVGSTPPAFFNSTSNIRIGAYTSSNADMFSQGIDWVEVRSGLTPTAGTVIWRFDAADWSSGTSWTDARSHTWLVSTGSAITDVAPTSVRLRWYDPVLGTFTNIAVGEAPSASRTVSFPSGTHSDNNTDWVLVVDDRTDMGVNSGLHGHTADNVPITVSFSVDSATHGHTSTPITLVTGLIVDSALHAHAATNVSVTTGLAVDSATHGHIAGNVTGLGVGILVDSALHGHTATNVDVAAPGVVNSAFHAHIATHITLTVVAISKIRLGSVTPQTMKVGTAPVARVYLGNTQVF
jgi:hypothetical protein